MARKNFYKLKVVKTRKLHECEACDESIVSGSRALVENGFNRLEGFFSNYFHIDEKSLCHLTYLDVVQPSDTTIKARMEDQKFFGELLWKSWKED